MKIDRNKIYNKYQGHCAYCGVPITLKEMQVDHIQAKSRFKETDFNPACKPCNIRKNTLTIEEFRKEIKRDILQLRRDSAKFRTLERFQLIKQYKKALYSILKGETKYESRIHRYPRRND
jgi:5-methylcytosine-specific restriction endonuclease McrA